MNLIKWFGCRMKRISNSFYFCIACKVFFYTLYSFAWCGWNENADLVFLSYHFQTAMCERPVLYKTLTKNQLTVCYWLFLKTANYIPQCSVDLFEGIWYLVRVDEKYRRTYAWHPLMGDGLLEAGVEVIHPGIVCEVNTVHSLKVLYQSWNNLCLS